MKRILGLSVALALLVSSGCASARTTQGRGGSRTTTLTAEQIAAANSDNLYDIVIKLRPEWLTSRGPASALDMNPNTVDIYMAGNMLGKVEVLRDIRLADVTELRYWDAAQASARYGMGHPRGVIEIIRK